jgi:hypothetical protein
MMKKLLTSMCLAVGLFVQPVSAQTVANTTTLSAALTSTASVMSVTSNTGFTVNNYAYIDGEAVRITSVSGTSIGIVRGQLGGSPAQAHANSDRVITGASGHFQSRDPDYGAACTKGEGDAAFQPWINVLNGLVWTCDELSTNDWAATKTAPITYDSIPTSFNAS